MAKNKKCKRVSSLNELKSMCERKQTSFFIHLNFGMRSSKSIYYEPVTDSFTVLNEIDDTEQVLNSKQIMDDDYTNIGKAIRFGSFYKY